VFAVYDHNDKETGILQEYQFLLKFHYLIIEQHLDYLWLCTQLIPLNLPLANQAI
jgi:hypothetical protein